MFIRVLRLGRHGYIETPTTYEGLDSSGPYIMEVKLPFYGKILDYLFVFRP